MWVKTSITDVSGAIMTICSRRKYLTSYIHLVMFPKIAHVEEQFQLRVTLLYFTSVEAVFFFFFIPRETNENVPIWQCFFIPIWTKC